MDVSLIDGDKVVTVKALGDRGSPSSSALDFESPYLLRRPYMNLQNVNLLGTSQYLSAAPWRRVLYSSPTVWACVKAHGDQLAALPWSITTKDKSEQHIKKSKIDYYTEEVVGKFNNENYDVGVLRCNRDILTIPQGGNCEVVYRTSGNWAGEVDRVENIDGGTLTATGNKWWPLIQRDPNDSRRYVVFYRDDVRRILLNPRPEYDLTGYQQSPLEMCYLAIDAIAKGDFYYLNFLTETPSAGILDLKDFTKAEAIVWSKSWKEMLSGNDALKIPILYEHEEDIKWIPFGQPPEAIMLAESLARYTKIIHANFGLYTQDTGLSEPPATGGREANLERRSWHRFNAVVASWENFWNSIISNDLVFKYEEINIEETERLARAKVANANALGIYLRSGILGITEARREISETGAIETYINTEEIPQDTIMPGALGGIRPEVAGQSRGLEQRLPEEGRRQALPAPRQPQRAEWYQRVRPKSLATMQGLNTILTDAFQGIIDTITDADLNQLLHDTSTLLIPAVMEAKSFTDSYDRWLEEFYLLDGGQESLLKSKAIIRKQRRAKELAKDLLQTYRWWDIADEELLAATTVLFKAAYEDALDDFNEQIWQALYEGGLVDSPYPEDYKPTLINSVILGELDAYANRMVANLNQGSQYYLGQILTRSVMENLSKPEIRERINEGEDIGEVIATLGLIDDMAQSFKASLTELIVPRADRAAAFEISNVIGSAKLQAMKSMGLTTKHWLTLGPDPCPICTGNAAQGDVPLDHQFDSAFGFTLWPLAHPFGECDITFDKAELHAIIDTGREITLYRGE